MSSFSEEIGKMVWSYSSLTTFERCKYEFYLNYIVKDDDLYLREGNYYAEVGSFVHEILAMIFDGKITKEQAFQYYIDNFKDNVFYMVKQSTMEKTYEVCKEYFATEDFKWLEHFEILGVEMEIKFQIDGRNFIGFIDLLVRDKRDGKIVIIDNKSSQYPFKKDGGIKAMSKNEFNKYKKQMYLYCYGVHEIYGEFPKEITWNHFKCSERFATIPFVKYEYDAAIKWALDTIHEAEKEENFEASHEFFYCKNLCNFRNSCEYADGGM